MPQEAAAALAPAVWNMQMGARQKGQAGTARPRMHSLYAQCRHSPWPHPAMNTCRAASMQMAQPSASAAPPPPRGPCPHHNFDQRAGRLPSTNDTAVVSVLHGLHCTPFNASEVPIMPSEGCGASCCDVQHRPVQRPAICWKDSQRACSL